jgi:hypothetical protein
MKKRANQFFSMAFVMIHSLMAQESKGFKNLIDFKKSHTILSENQSSNSIRLIKYNQPSIVQLPMREANIIFMSLICLGGMGQCLFDPMIQKPTSTILIIGFLISLFLINYMYFKKDKNKSE